MSDIINIHGIFESADTDAASSPKVTLTNLNSSSTTTSEFTLGEQIVGQNSGAVAIVAEKLSDSQISFLYKNDINL